MFACLQLFLCRKPIDEELKQLEKQLHDIARKNKVIILPLIAKQQTVCPTDNLDEFNTFVVTKSKQYVSLTTQNANILQRPNDLFNVIDALWDIVLLGVQLQCIFIWKSNAYFMNGLPHMYGKECVGGIIYMRGLDTTCADAVGSIGSHNKITNLVNSTTPRHVVQITCQKKQEAPRASVETLNSFLE